MICIPAQVLGAMTVLVPFICLGVGFVLGQHWENRP